MLPLGIFKKRRKDDLLLGRTDRAGFSPRFKISSKVRKFHMYVTGLTGRGKSKFLQNCLIQDIQAGRGCAVIDPHGDLVKDTLRSLISSDYPITPDRILYVAPRRRDYVVPFNVLARPDPEMETYEVAQRVISAFMRTWSRTLLEPPRFQQIMRSGLATLIETEETICSLYKLLTDDGNGDQDPSCQHAKSATRRTGWLLHVLDPDGNGTA
jgi:hypothetical protein